MVNAARKLKGKSLIIAQPAGSDIDLAMLQRRNNAMNGRNGATDETHSLGTPDDMVADSSRGPNDVDRSTSALNRRILPRHVDGRSAPAKRLMGLVRDLAKRVENPEDPITRARLVAASLLIMEQESLAHALAAGKVVDADTVVRVANATERALSRLK